MTGETQPIVEGRLDALPSIPLGVVRARFASGDPSHAPEAERLVLSDLAMAASVLRLANSPVYGRGGTITSLDAAVRILGAAVVRKIAHSLASLGTSTLALDRPRFFEHSVASAAASRALARRLGCAPPEDAYTAGLLHSLGQLVFACGSPDRYAEVLRRSAAGNRPLSEVEKEVFGIDHGRAGSLLADRWHLPGPIRDVIGHHMRGAEALESLPGGTRSLVQVVAAADWVLSSNGMATCCRDGKTPPKVGGKDLTAEDAGAALEAGRDMLRETLACFLAGGHVLLEGVPGTAKTLLVRCLGRAVDARFTRVQFTPDLMPADVTGVNMFHQDDHAFRFHPGPVFTDLLLADEINRAPAKTQSALLEAMQERRVTVDGAPHPLPPLFTTFATQNPVEYEGTYPLPEAELDRFLAKVIVGYPSEEEEVGILDRYAGGFDAEREETFGISPVADPAAVLAMREAVRSVHVEPSVRAYAVAVVRRQLRDEVGLALEQGGDARGHLRDRPQDHPVDVDLAAPVVGVGIEDRAVVLRPRPEAHGPRADRLLAEDLRAHRLQVLLGHDLSAVERQARRQVRIRLLGVDDQRRRIRSLDAVDGREDGVHPGLGRRVVRPLQAELRVGRAERIAVVELHARPELEDPRRLALHAPLGGQALGELAVRVAARQVVEDVERRADVVRRRVHVRIERGHVAPLGDHQLSLGRRLGRRRPCQRTGRHH
ncbi:MAG: AAA family ATPase, partial [Planctomycetaceae bacterium]|nr:AAA family ATPase [Planctomycetaceae bacterium]